MDLLLSTICCLIFVVTLPVKEEPFFLFFFYVTATLCHKLPNASFEHQIGKKVDVEGRVL